MEQTLLDTAQVDAPPEDGADTTTAEPRNGRPRLSAFLIYAALVLGGLCLLTVLAAVAVAEYLPPRFHGLTTPLIVAIMTLWGLSAFAWIGSINARPVPTDDDRRAALDEQITALTAARAALGERPPAPVGAGLLDLTDEDRAAIEALRVPDDDEIAETERRDRGDGRPRPRRRRQRVLAAVGADAEGAER